VRRPRLEVADIFDRHGAAWRRANAGHVSLGQLQVMSAIESCRTAALGGHVARCEACAHSQIAYNSCRNRHCPKCQGAAAKDWLAAREADLLPVPYFHLVFTLPAEIGDIAYQNKAVIYDALFKASSEALLTIAADPKHLGARVGITAVLHTWGSAMTHHPHVHGIVPGGGISLDGSSWVRCRPGFLLPVRVLSKLFRRLMLGKLAAAHAAGKLRFFGQHARLAAAAAFAAFLAPLQTTRWFVYAKRPFAGPQAVLAYLSRYTHRVAIANSRLIAADDDGVTFRYKDYRRNGQERYRAMTLVPGEFIRRFLLHVLPRPRVSRAASVCAGEVRRSPWSWLAPAAQAGDRADQLHRGIQRLIEAEPRLETVAGRIGDGELHGIQAGILWPRRHGQMPMLYTANIHHHVPVPLNRERGRMYQHYFCRI
jgi:Putative transposase/Transposase zinc-binding domain